jgi:exopolysaccharide production protein ExoQ
MFALPALFSCFIFIGWLLVREHRRRPSLSAALWIPTFFLLIVGSRPLSMWFGASLGYGVVMGNEAERSPTDQLFFLVVLVSAWIVATLRGVKWGKFFAANAPLMVFYLFFLISILWSSDPIGSSKRLFKDFGMLFVIAVIFSEKDPLQALRSVYVRCACVLFPLSVVFIKYFPAYARAFAVAGEPMYTGVTTQKNSLGEIVLVFGLFLFWDYLDTRSAHPGWQWKRLPWEHVLLVVMGFWLLHMCQSKTALVCLFIGAALIARKGWLASKMVSRVALLVALSLPYIAFFAQQFSSVIAPMVQALGRTMTFTGRTDIWEHITLKTVNPLIGSGYWNFWGGAGAIKINQEMHTLIPNAHNGYLDIYLDGGLIGLILLFCLLVAYGRRLMKNLQNDRFQRVRFAVLIVMIIYNISESMYARLSPIWFTTLLVMVDFPGLKKYVKRKGTALAEKDDGLPPTTARQPLWVRQ